MEIKTVIEFESISLKYDGKLYWLTKDHKDHCEAMEVDLDKFEDFLNDYYDRHF